MLIRLNRYNQESTANSIALDHSHSHYNLPLYQTSSLEPAPEYPHDGGGNYYQPTNAYSPVDAKPRFGPSNPSSTGMDHTPRTTLPHPETRIGQPFSIRSQYSSVTPNFGRPSDHSCRSPSIVGSHQRRNPISPSPSIATGFSAPANRMDPQFSNRGTANSIPPLEDIKILGALRYQDHQKTEVNLAINGIIDKGFFLADKHWTCYRRNYFSCVCSYSLTPYLPGVAIELKIQGSRPATICGFSMSISAVVAENGQAIDLVQHTPKRDKGPISSPPKTPLMAKQDTNHHQHMGSFFGGSGIPSHQAFPDGWVPSEQGGNVPLTEYTFERIQFKQATQNNGKRRAQQQYYHLVIELYANIADSIKPNWVRVAYRRSAQMIVRGRSPGHYQDRRGSSSNPSAGAGGTSGQFGLAGSVRDYGVSPLMQAPSSYGGFDGHGSLYGHHHRHQGLPHEVMIPQEDEKAIESNKGYQYYPGTIGDAHQNPRVELWNHTNDSEPLLPQVIQGVDIHGKVKNEYENNTLPRLVHPHSLSNPDHSRPCRPFDGKPTSNGYYPHVISPSSMSITM